MKLMSSNNKNKIEMEDLFDNFQCVNKLEVPDGLYEKIQERIYADGKNRYSKKETTLISTLFLFFVLLNVYTIVTYSFEYKKKSNDRTSEISWLNNNNLYNE